ncbi:Protein serine/threonine phosphatase [Pseudodesulfovibrio profundus]|uniref:Protein serine/threonine phosphatase n=1 Tax=Pseudodesulfovibrio profundus TaxID=57320 RepID=A0A2C8FCB4_9BACT|nr:SpoIIE family protein phosphatase [Pseudodesulfovibrio profundus]SOB60091.1 Protein serine/threonine phosphatase [Pseudodesulfovibrio profundus]
MSVMSILPQALLNWSVERKMTVLLLVIIVLFPLATFVILQSGGTEQATNFLIGIIVASIVLLVPFAKWMSHVLALGSIKDINAQCLLLKEGKYAQVDLPPVEAEGNDFQTLKRNMHWMGHTIAVREHRLQAAMAKLATAQRQIGESLDYAHLIQTSFLPARAELSDYIPNHFLIWEQRDTVGGDAYWLKHTENGFFVGVIDCTGHGVPGAFMTLIVAALLEKAASDGTTSPAVVLGRMNRLIKESLGQTDRDAQSDDGMDCSLCHVDSETGEIVFSGANSPLFIVDDEGARCIKGDRCGLGYVRSDPDFVFTDVPIETASAQRIYLASDGLLDQVGGERNFPFGKRRFMEFLEQHRKVPLDAQGAELVKVLNGYQGNETRRDDVTVIGFEL